MTNQAAIIAHATSLYNGGAGSLLRSWPAQYTCHCGAIAQLGERIVRNDEVVGSIPTSSTKSFNNLQPVLFRSRTIYVPIS